MSERQAVEVILERDDDGVRMIIGDDAECSIVLSFDAALLLARQLMAYAGEEK